MILKFSTPPCLTGEYLAIPTPQGGVKRYNIKETPCRKAPPFRAESFNRD